MIALHIDVGVLSRGVRAARLSRTRCPLVEAQKAVVGRLREPCWPGYANWSTGGPWCGDAGAADRAERAGAGRRDRRLRGDGTGQGALTAGHRRGTGPGLIHPPEPVGPPAPRFDRQTQHRNCSRLCGGRSPSTRPAEKIFDSPYGPWSGECGAGGGTQTHGLPLTRQIVHTDQRRLTWLVGCLEGVQHRRRDPAAFGDLQSLLLCPFPDRLVLRAMLETCG
jgi:hypothetical protein